MTNPEPIIRLPSLEKEVYRPDYSAHIEIVAKVVYFEIAKAASSTIRSVLGTTTSIRSLGPERFFELVDSSEAFIFSFVRNPYARLVSCYKDKFAPCPVSFKRGCMKDAHRYFGRELRSLPPNEPLPLPMFVEMACATNESGTDGHWLLMDRMIPKRTVQCHFIGRVESIETDLLVVEGHLGRRFPMQHLNKTDSSPSILTPDLKRKIFHAYRADFDRFGYLP